METTVSATDLRDALVSQLKTAGYLRTAAVERAFRSVPRHLFVPPEVEMKEAYRDEVIPLVAGLATLSQPSIVALMLERLGVRPGDRVLEVGTASGYNAALLAEMAGAPNLVHSIEIDPHLAEVARANLASAGYRGVHVRAGDGSLGWPDGAPYDRIILTAEATELSRHLLAQLDAGGVLLVPFGAPGLPALLLRLQRTEENCYQGNFAPTPVTFVPMRGEYGAGYRSHEDGGRVARLAILEVERIASEEGAFLSFAQRLALDLAAVGFVDGASLEASDTARSAWLWFVAAGLPSLGSLTVEVVPRELVDTPGPLLRRRDYAFRIGRESERNPVQGSESPGQEGMP